MSFFLLVVIGAAAFALYWFTWDIGTALAGLLLEFLSIQRIVPLSIPFRANMAAAAGFCQERSGRGTGRFTVAVLSAALLVFVDGPVMVAAFVLLSLFSSALISCLAVRRDKSVENIHRSFVNTIRRWHGPEVAHMAAECLGL